MLRTGALILALLLLAPTWSGEASDETVLIEFELKSGAQPLSVSAGGAVVVGGLTTSGGFYWMPTTRVIYAGGRVATRVSRDGKVIVGEADDARGVHQAAIWQRGTEWRLLGSFPNALPCDAFLSLANNTSGDGKVVVGYARNGCALSHAFRLGRIDEHGRSGQQRCGPRDLRPLCVRGRAGCRLASRLT
jgi:uncharacterized membrane protein